MVAKVLDTPTPDPGDNGVNTQRVGVDSAHLKGSINREANSLDTSFKVSDTVQQLLGSETSISPTEVTGTYISPNKNFKLHVSADPAVDRETHFKFKQIDTDVTIQYSMSTASEDPTKDVSMTEQRLSQSWSLEDIHNLAVEYFEKIEIETADGKEWRGIIGEDSFTILSPDGDISTYVPYGNENLVQIFKNVIYEVRNGTPVDAVLEHYMYNTALDQSELAAQNSELDQSSTGSPEAHEHAAEQSTSNSTPERSESITTINSLHFSTKLKDGTSLQYLAMPDQSASMVELESKELGTVKFVVQHDENLDGSEWGELINDISQDKTAESLSEILAEHTSAIWLQRGADVSISRIGIIREQENVSIEASGQNPFGHDTSYALAPGQTIQKAIPAFISNIKGKHSSDMASFDALNETLCAFSKLAEPKQPLAFKIRAALSLQDNSKKSVLNQTVHGAIGTIREIGKVTSSISEAFGIHDLVKAATHLVKASYKSNAAVGKAAKEEAWNTSYKEAKEHVAQIFDKIGVTDTLTAVGGTVPAVLKLVFNGNPQPVAKTISHTFWGAIKFGSSIGAVGATLATGNPYFLSGIVLRAGLNQGQLAQK